MVAAALPPKLVAPAMVVVWVRRMRTAPLMADGGAFGGIGGAVATLNSNALAGGEGAGGGGGLSAAGKGTPGGAGGFGGGGGGGASTATINPGGNGGAGGFGGAIFVRAGALTLVNSAFSTIVRRAG